MNTTDQITVFGANGRVGRQVVSLLLERGAVVIAAVHSDSHLLAHPHLSVVPVDVYDQLSVSRALKGSSAVISVLGSWGTKRQDILTTGITHIISGMQASGISRLVSLTGAEARLDGDRLVLIHRLMHAALMMIAPKILIDGERHMALLAASKLDWTVLRSPVMSAAGTVGSGILSLDRPLPWQRISRRLVVEAIVQSLDDTTWVRKAPYIS